MGTPASLGILAAMAPEPLCLLSVHAHPDDESSKGAGTVARYHAEGVRTVLVCCTGGEEGDILNPAMDQPGGEGRHRGRAAAPSSTRRPPSSATTRSRCSATATRACPTARPTPTRSCFAQAPIDEAVGRLVAIIRRTRPQVILTYGDEQGGYPHPDHIRVHDITQPAVDRAADPDWYPEAGEPWQVSKIYYSVWSRKRIELMHAKFLELGPRVALQRGLVQAPVAGRPHHHVDRHRGLRRGALRGAARPRHPDRSRVAVLVRPAPRGRPRRSTPTTTTSAPRASSTLRRPRTTCSPASAPRSTPDRGEGAVPERGVARPASALVGATCPSGPGATARVQHVVTGAPDGEVRYVHAIVDGRTAELALGDDDDAEVTFTQHLRRRPGRSRRGARPNACCSCRAARRWPATWARCSR